ncbi:dead/deah box helicase [Rhodococcus opacus M213]|uniref:Dead/deah box helicase n=1 Tax=Rhodococcus opacus M213 TaxID=1129896 RepID=K8X5Y1_RHOOP|nr:DEAD/DEAH box helicase [Rhodococcus opacus]EKT76858.1 dead/deah box helicase [Rhodococcus opacus M213]
MTDRLDPLAAGAGIEAGYKRYLKTLLAPRDPALAAAFDAAIDESTLLTKGPLLELTPPYAPGASLADLVADGTLHRDFPLLASESLPMNRPLYQHQEAAIRKVVAGRNLVVSTGTGSGKTESFLLPILNSLIEERANGTLGPGVRALLLYPMNALANDQLKRLRGLLAGMPDITFGRYTGETLQSTRDAESVFRASNPGEKPLPNELLSRDQMRAEPPHILLTNYAMLEYLLLRPADLDLFDGEHSGTWKFIALDEAHVYDGAQGAEVGLLLRRLRERVGQNRPLQCIATSASLTGRTPETQGIEATTFAHNLFDVPFEYVDDEPSRQDLVTPTRQKRRETPDWTIGDQLLLDLADPDASLDMVSAHSSDGDPAAALQAEQRTADLQSTLARGPVAIRDLESRLWPDDPDAGSKLEALVALGSRVRDRSGNPVLSARYHMFVRATEGAYVTFTDDGPSVVLGRHEVDPVTGRAVFEFGTCQRCGAVHLAGDRETYQGREYFRPVKREDRVRWLVLTDTAGEGLIDEDEATLAEGGSEEAQTSIRSLCAGCGSLGAGACTDPKCPGGPSLGVREHKQSSAVMSKCTECGARSRQVIRRLRTDTNAAPAVITTALYQHIPRAADKTVEEVGEGRKLLMFSDSRQAAAFAAPYLGKTYGRMLERRYLTMVLTDPKFRDDELSADDLADYASKKARDAYHFEESATRATVKRTVNPWVMAELMALDTRQSLEGLGLMGVRMFRSRRAVLPPVFEKLGMSTEETWGLLDELLKTVRLQGAMTLLDDVDIKQEIFEPRNTQIRIRSRDSDPSKRIISWMPAGRPGTTNNRILLVRKVLTTLDASMPADKLLAGCWQFLLEHGYVRRVADKTAGDVYQVDHEKLRIVPGADSDWYQCSACRRLTTNDIRGVCPFGACDGTLQSFAVPAPEDDTNHYRSMYRTLRPAPLSAMEHTAQWESKKAAEIQKNFIDGKVNVLSCSTTFELGVDVGDLQSVVLRNMPPKTANYVQRAGRAGRRAASAALVLTYAKRSSHDLSKYQNPESMIAGEMRIPWIPIENERIARRHAHSIALAAYFRDRYENDGVSWRFAGEFFSPGSDGQDSPASQVRTFLTPVPGRVAAAIRQVVPESIASAIGIDDGSWVERLCDLLAIAEHEMRNDLDTYRELIEQAKESNNLGLGARLQRTLKTIESRQLLGYLANKNILPKYGFPVDTVELRTTHCEGDVGASLELSRDLSQAIYDYAPGNQVVAGGKLWTSRGLQKLPKRELVELKYRTCVACQQFQCGTELDVEEVCPSCQQPFGKIRRFVVPEFGFVADRKVEDVKPEPPERRWGGSSYVENLGDISDPFPWQSTGGVEVQARAGTRARMVVVSDGGGAGFQLCGRCGWAAPLDRKSSKSAHKHPVTDKSCEGSTRIVSLAHRYETDIAEFSFGAIAYDNDSVGRWLSVLYALLEGASEALEISRDDIDGTLSWTPDGRRSFVLFDTVPAGAGAAKRIAENLGKVIQFAVDRVTRCDCGEETSCYGCLRSFRNERHHDKLSRQGALSIFAELKVEATPEVVDGPWGETLAYTSQSVIELLLKLSKRGVEKPELGVDLGQHYWPVEAVWMKPGVVLVEGYDEERDSGLASDGYTVVKVEDTDIDQLAPLLPAG